MKIAVITDIPRLYEKTMYLSELQIEAQKNGIEMDILVLNSPRSLVLDRKFPIYRILRAALLTNKMRSYDLLHVQFTLPHGLIVALAKTVHGKPILIHTHGYDVFALQPMNIGLRRIKVADFLVKTTWKASSGIITVCDRARKELIKSGVCADKVDTVYNGVNERLFTKKTRATDSQIGGIRKDDELIFLDVGNLVPVKNQTNLLIAFSRFHKRDDSTHKSKLVICGNGPLKYRLRAVADRLHLRNKVIFVGQIPHERMPELYSAADVFILPSLSEAHPWSLLEAMSCELPVIASDVGGIPETVPSEELLLDPLNPHDICDKMCRFAGNPGLRKLLGSENRRIILEKFTFKRHMINLKATYSQLLK